MEVIHGIPASDRLKGCALTVGTFDGVHSAHVSILDQLVSRARSLGVPSVLVTFDPHPRTLLHTDAPAVPLLSTMEEKLHLLSTTGLDYLVIYPFTIDFSALSPSAYLDEFIYQVFNPTHILVGFDHRFGHGRMGDFDLMADFCASNGIELEKIEQRSYARAKISSTAIRTALMTGAMDDANAMLGYAYRITGTVVHGQALGRTIGYPTANLSMTSTHKLIPSDGVYAAYAHVHDQRHVGLLFIGQKSNSDGQRPSSVEVHIKGYAGDLYGELITLELIAYIRDNRHFDTLDELRRQIHKDERQIERMLMAYDSERV